MKMNKRYFSPLLAVAVFATATVANAAVHRVYPGESIQEVIDNHAQSGDTILVEPGEYTTGNDQFGLRISTDNLRLIGKVKKGRGNAGKVILRHSGTQETGVYAAPADCGPELAVGECPDELKGFYIRGFTVQDFPGNGIQTRFVNGFKIIRNESADNLHNGIYPTISANGLVQNNVSYGALDTAMWVAASQNVRVIGNDLYDSPIGLEVNVSLDITVKHNDVHDNTVGIALFHPNSAGNLPLEEMGNWVVTHNNVYDNNLPNPAAELDPVPFQGILPQGVGILLLGVSDNVVAKNTVENNEFVGIGLLGWCTATIDFDDYNCDVKPPIIPFPPTEDSIFYDPAVNNNMVSHNKLSGNGGNPPLDDFPDLGQLASDIIYLQAESDPGESGNCFKKNKPKDFTFYSSEPYGATNPAPPEFGGELPTDGC